MREFVRSHPGVIALAILCVASGVAVVLEIAFHLGVPLTIATIVGVLVGLPGLFLAWRAVAGTGTTAGLDPAQAAGQLSRVVVEPGEHDLGWPVSLPLRPQELAGRERLLSDLHTLLTEGDRPWPRTVTLCGLGGVGKTSMAAEYVHRHLGEVAVAWQLAAEDPVVLAAGFADLAAQLGVRDVATTRDPVKSAHSALAAHPAVWMLIFDNAPGAAQVRRFLPPSGHGRVLITSQSAIWPVGQIIEVPVLNSDVAAKFLVSRTAEPDSQAAGELAAGLGGLPLALEQAAAYIRATGITLSGYLGLFRARRAELLARGEVLGHPATVASTLGLASSRLEHDSPAAAALLRLLACLAPEPVPLSVLLAHGSATDGLDPDVAATLTPLLGDQVAAADAVAALRQYSLITPAGGGLVLVHRLVQAVTVDQMSSDQAAQWRRAAATLVEAAIPADITLPETWPTCAALLPHARITLASTEIGAGRIANYLGFSGNHPAAVELWQAVALARAETLGPQHPDTLDARADLAAWTGMAGDLPRARDMYAALLPIRERVCGADHADTLSTRSNLAYFTGEAGDQTTARDQYAELLPIQERALGVENPATLTTRHNLAATTGAVGNPWAARDQYAELLPIRERVLGLEHPDALTTRNNLALWTGEAGDPAAARDKFAELLPIRERVLGPEHPHTLATRANLARWTGEAGDPAAARDQLAELLPIRERVLGPEHPHTLATRANLARWTATARKRRHRAWRLWRPSAAA